MKDLWAILKYEAQQLLSKPVVIALVLILAAGLAFIQLHTIEYKDLQAQKAIFQAVEKTVIESYATYRHYGTYGFRLMFLPSPISILFANSSLLQDMMANIETGFRMPIYQSLKSRNIFGIFKYLFADFSGIFFVFVGLVAVFYGFPAFRSQEYLKTLASIAGKKNLFRNIFLARAILLALYNLLFLASAVLLIALNGVSIGIDQYLVVFFIEMCCVTTFFLVLGAAFGSVKSFNWGQRGIIISWLILLLILPFLLDLIVSVNAATIKPETQLEIEKLKLMMDFEKRSIKKHGYLDLNKDANEAQRGIILDYYKNEFQRMQALEDQLKAQMQDCKKMHYLLSSFFPTTFYQSLTNELSSKGYETLEAFYNTVKQIKEAFFKEYIKQVYFLPQPTKAEPFLKGDENIFEGKPALPGYLILGFCFNLLWIAALALIAYPCFKKRLAEVPEKKKEDREPNDVHVKTGELRSWRLYGRILPILLYNLLSNQIHDFIKKGYTLKFTFDGQPPAARKPGLNFLYLCQLSELPGDIRTVAYINQIMALMGIDRTKRKEIKASFNLDALKSKKLSQLEYSEMGRIYLAILEMKTFPIYLIDDIGKDMPLDFCTALKDKIIALWDAGSTILFLSSEAHFPCEDKTYRQIAVESDGWFKKITRLHTEKEDDETEAEDVEK